MVLNSHSESVFSIPGFLSSDECRWYIEEAEKIGFEAAGVRMKDGSQQKMLNIRNNDRIGHQSEEWAEKLWARLSGFPIPEIEGQRAVGLASLFRFYRYAPGQRFKMHKDGGLKEGEYESRLSFLVYLNAGYEGGETDFKAFKIHPEEGMALLFVHQTWHEGRELSKGTKYVLRSDVLYG